MTPSQPLGPPVVVPSDPLPFPLSVPLSAKSPPYVQILHRSPAPTLPPPSPKAQEEECQAGGGEQEITLEELCKPLYCKLCNVTLNSAQQAQAHYQVSHRRHIAGFGLLHVTQLQCLPEDKLHSCLNVNWSAAHRCNQNSKKFVLANF